MITEADLSILHGKLIELRMELESFYLVYDTRLNDVIDQIIDTYDLIHSNPDEKETDHG